jgi:glycosyltransferase involved in cell wall biosynthesis
VYVATEGPLGWSAVTAARRLCIPVFSGFHTNFDTYSEHYHAGWLRALIFRYLIAFHNRTAGTFVATGDLRDRLEARGVKNVSVVGRGVDSRLFTPERRNGELRRSWQASDADLVALYVGRIAAEKNIALAIESYRAMRGVNAAVRFVIVGDGPERAGLQKLHPDLIFCGTQTGERLAEHYASADIFLFPSETETFGNVTLEAMASGLAVLAYDYAAARAHITHGASGVLAPLGNSHAFIDAAVELARGERFLADLRQRAREHAVIVDWRRVTERFTAVLAMPIDRGSADGTSESIEATPLEAYR